MNNTKNSSSHKSRTNIATSKIVNQHKNADKTLSKTKNKSIHTTKNNNDEVKNNSIRPTTGPNTTPRTIVITTSGVLVRTRATKTKHETHLRNETHNKKQDQTNNGIELICSTFLWLKL